ncbi:hypothetical protein AARAC_011556 [Aspergillus arachidicola]|uniref:Uncharacterized protein n=1 Tax=Aspergillus arachidicola TaxID=656916 RepID=A0A2G7EPM6_9EURO|nr:hypothetical protein AARAC_011556 [Aspergillus arachidicola]
MDLSPDCFTNVMAISSGNSIFASGSILCDPWEDAKPHEIQRLVASIGKSGVSLLIPPMNPKLRKAEFDTWKLIDHIAFDGSVEDHFDNTSIQLSFTRYESPVPGAVFHGAQDVEANYVETLAQVYDGSKWVGDIDILSALSSNFIERISLPHPCQGHPSRPKPRFPALSIDNWDELIDAPSTAGVIRAHDNFVGTLAAHCNLGPERSLDFRSAQADMLGLYRKLYPTLARWAFRGNIHRLMECLGEAYLGYLSFSLGYLDSIFIGLPDNLNERRTKPKVGVRLGVIEILAV